MPERPNVLFLMDDEHRPDVFGYAGDDIVRTPTLNELADTGTVFTNAYTPAPVCVPARQAMMAGQLPRTCDCLGWEDLDPEYYTFSRHFAEHGYMTTAAGKLHHQGWDQMQGWRKRLGPTPMKRPLHHTYLKKDSEAFEKWEKDYDPDSKWKWSYTKEVKRAGIGNSRVQVQDQRSIEGTEQYIRQYFNSPYYDRQRANERPLLLKVSLIQPHFPYFTSEKKFNYYLNRVEPYLEDSPDHPFLRKHTVKPSTDASKRELQRATAAYYGMVETVDEYFGRIMDALGAVGENLDQWIIVFTSDHGEMLGEHGVWEKKKFYEASARVPLIIRWPERYESSQVVDRNINLCDLYATLAELAGLPIPDGLDSRSLVPLMEGNIKNWQNETISQYDGRNLLIKQDQLKYQYYGEEMPEVLFDLRQDSTETKNFINDPEYADDVEEFRSRRDELGYGQEGDSEYDGAGY